MTDYHKEKNYEYKDIIYGLLSEKDWDKLDHLFKNLDTIKKADFLISASHIHREEFYKKFLKDNAEVMPELNTEILKEILAYLGMKDFTRLIRNLPSDEIYDIIEHFTQEIQEEILCQLPYYKAQVLTEVLSYPTESAGRMIQKDFITAHPDWTINQVIELLRTYKTRHIQKELYDIYITDPDKRPIGRVNLTALLCNDRNTKISNIMLTDFKKIETGLGQEETAILFRKYELLSAPVINENQQMIGVISCDDIMHVIQEEAEEDLLHLGKISENDLNAGILHTFRKRIVWLFITFFTINIASFVIGFFNETLKKSVTISILMPIIAAMAGNSGMQSATIAIRALVTGQLSYINYRRVLLKELLIGLFNGIALSICIFTTILLRYHNMEIEFIFVFSMLFVVTIATVVGSAIPIIIHRLGGDPALSSSVITSSITDILSFLILLSISSIIL